MAVAVNPNAFPGKILPKIDLESLNEDISVTAAKFAEIYATNVHPVTLNKTNFKLNIK